MGKLISLYNTNPYEAASKVLGNWMQKALAEAGNWAANYQARVQEAANDPGKMQEASLKLGIWYNELLRIAPSIGSLYAQAKEAYKSRLRQMRQRTAPTPTPRPRAVEVYAQA